MSTRQEKIVSVTRLEAPKLTPELRLHLVTKHSPWWTKTPEELQNEGIPEPFWAFAWAGGQALARYILDHPEVVRGCDVVDFGAGGGIVSLAARAAEARSIHATEIDPWAIDAYTLNVKGGVISLDNWIGRKPPAATVLLCGDMSYSKELCDEFLEWFADLKDVRILIGDAGRGFVPRSQFRELAQYQTPADYDSDGLYFVKSSVLEYRSEITC